MKQENNFWEETWTPQREQTFHDTGKASAFMRMVYTIMAIGLSITGLTAWYFGTNIYEYPWLTQGFMPYIIMFAPLGFVLALSFGLHKMSYTTASLVFGVYSLVMGLSLSYIFVIYDVGTIFKTFFVTAGTFGAMSIVGYTTNIDLSRFGSILMMALIGLIIAMVVNMFFGSPMIDYIISIAGVVIFCGLTAYDTQNLMEIGVHADVAEENTRKFALIGALSLYLNFVNLFLFLLRIFGGGRD